jgi:hypothetical protein
MNEQGLERGVRSGTSAGGAVSRRMSSNTIDTSYRK